ncbi:MAG: hypothetical protein ACI4C1_02435 [Lachnospiraceae bacterium]
MQQIAEIASSDLDENEALNQYLILADQYWTNERAGNFTNSQLSKQTYLSAVKRSYQMDEQSNMKGHAKNISYAMDILGIRQTSEKTAQVSVGIKATVVMSQNGYCIWPGCVGELKITELGDNIAVQNAEELYFSGIYVSMDLQYFYTNDGWKISSSESYMIASAADNKINTNSDAIRSNSDAIQEPAKIEKIKNIEIPNIYR